MMGFFDRLAQAIAHFFAILFGTGAPSIQTGGTFGGPSAATMTFTQPGLMGEDTVTTPTHDEGMPINTFVESVTTPGAATTVPIPPAAAAHRIAGKFRQKNKIVNPASFSGYHVPIIPHDANQPSYEKVHTHMLMVSRNQFSTQTLRPQSPSGGIRARKPPAKVRSTWVDKSTVSRGTITGPGTNFAAHGEGPYTPRGFLQNFAAGRKQATLSGARVNVRTNVTTGS